MVNKTQHVVVRNNLIGFSPLALPALHPGFCPCPKSVVCNHPWCFVTAIPTVENGGNHTRAFTDAARTIEAHKACLNVSKALAGVGIRVLTDEAFTKNVGVNYVRTFLANC